MTINLVDLPVFTEVELPDFGASMEWVANDLFKRDYQGLLQHPALGLVVYRNADLNTLGTSINVSHQEMLLSQGATLEDTRGIERFMLNSTFSKTQPQHKSNESKV